MHATKSGHFPTVQSIYLLWWQKFFQFGNDCGIHTFWKLHVELNYEFALFKWIAIGRHSFAVDAFEISGLYALA